MKLATRPFSIRREVRLTQPASIYALSLRNNTDYVKLSLTSQNIQQHLSLIEKHIGCQYDLLFEIKVPAKFAHRVEGLVHAQFRNRQYSLYLPKSFTQREWFKVSVQELETSVLKWTAWMVTEPYQISLLGRTRNSEKRVVFELKQDAVPGLQEVVDAVLHSDSQSPHLSSVTSQQPSDRPEHRTDLSTTLDDSLSYLIREPPLLPSLPSITEGSVTATGLWSHSPSGTTLVEDQESDENEERLISLLLQYDNVQDLSLQGTGFIGLDNFRSQLQHLIEVFGGNVAKEAKLPKDKVIANWIRSKSHDLSTVFRARLLLIQIKEAGKSDAEMSVNDKLALIESKSNQQLVGQRKEADLQVLQNEVNAPSLGPRIPLLKEGQTGEQLEFEEIRAFLLQSRAILLFHKQLRDIVDSDPKSVSPGSANETSSGQLLHKFLWPMRDELDLILTVQAHKFQAFMSDLRLIIKRSLRPSLIPGYQRIEWTCVRSEFS